MPLTFTSIRSGTACAAALLTLSATLAATVPPAMAAVHPDSHGPGIQIKVRPGPLYEVAGLGAVWVLSDNGTSEISRVDPATNQVTGVVHLGFVRVYGSWISGSLSTGFGSVWVSEFSKDRVVRIDPSTLKVVASIRTGVSPTDVLVAFGAVWVADINSNEMQRIDPTTDKVDKDIPIGTSGVYGDGPNLLSTEGNLIWATEPGEDSIVAVDPATRQVVDTESVAPAYACGKALPVAGGFWLDDSACGFTVSRYDLASHSVVASFTVDTCLWGATVYQGHLWTVEDLYHPHSDNCRSGSLYKRNLVTGDLIESEHIASNIIDVVGLKSSLWTNNYFYTNHVIRVPLF